MIAVDSQGLPVEVTSPDQFVGSSPADQDLEYPDIGGSKKEPENSDGKSCPGSGRPTPLAEEPAEDEQGENRLATGEVCGGFSDGFQSFARGGSLISGRTIVPVLSGQECQLGVDGDVILAFSWPDGSFSLPLLLEVSLPRLEGGIVRDGNHF